MTSMSIHTLFVLSQSTPFYCIKRVVWINIDVIDSPRCRMYLTSRYLFWSFLKKYCLYSMRKKSFFDNLGAILAYALLGTIISTAIIALGDHLYTTSDLFKKNFGPTQKDWTIPSILKILSVKNARAKVFCGIFLSIKKFMLKIWKRSWEQFEICLLNTIANPAQFLCFKHIFFPIRKSRPKKLLPSHFDTS